MTGSSDTRPFGRWFQLRWAERLGDPERPYLVRWTLILFGYSVRLHHWMRSDDRRYFHDHSSDLLSIVLKGEYDNVVPKDPDYPPDFPDVHATVRWWGRDNCRPLHVHGMFNSLRDFFRPWNSIWFSKAEQRHFLNIPREGAWTLLFEGRKRQSGASTSRAEASTRSAGCGRWPTSTGSGSYKRTLTTNRRKDGHNARLAQEDA